MKDHKKENPTKTEYILTILLAIVLAIFVNTYIVSFSKISGTSMMPTLKNRQIVLVNNFSVKIQKKPIERDKIVLVRFKGQDKTFIKRVIGLPGETIEIKGTDLYINGKLKEEPYINKTYNDNYNLCEKNEISKEEYQELYKKEFGDIKVKLDKDQYFVMGDNRLNSTDSRFLGPCLYEDIIGVVKK